MKKITLFLVLLSLTFIFLEIFKPDSPVRFSVFTAQTEAAYDYSFNMGRLTFKEERRFYEIFKTLYFPFILLYNYTGIVGCFLIGMGAILASLMGISAFEGGVRMFFIFLLVYLLGPFVFYVWAYVFPGVLNY